MMYYDAHPCGTSGLFDTDTLEVRKGYYAFYQFKELRSLGTCLKTDVHGEDIYACAATDGKDGAIMLTHYIDVEESLEAEVCVHIEGVGSKGVRAEYYLLDEEHNNILVREETLSSDSFSLRLNMKLFDTYLIKLISL